MKWFGKYGRKVGWIVKKIWKIGWIVKWYETYGRKLCNDMENMEERQVEMWNDMENMEKSKVE